MALRSFIAFASMALLLSGWVCAQETAASLFAKANESLANGDFDKALQGYARASKANPAEKEYQSRYMLVRRVIQVRGKMAQERDPQRWTYMALSLRSFYYRYRVYSEALTLDRLVHERVNNADSASLLGETLLILGQNEDAARLLDGLPDETPLSRILLGIGLARSGSKQRAAEIAGALDAGESNPILAYHAARLHALLDNADVALRSLRRCFEQTPPSQSEFARETARDCGDFAVLASNPGFAGVLRTQSLLRESGCSGGSSCGTCPRRGTCGGSGN